MQTRESTSRQHDHVFAQDRERPGEKRTLIVVLITAVMMVVEIVAGLAYGSMALLADGLHMASHAAALGIAFLAYVVARRLAADQRFSFGTGKLNSLAGFASAVLLLGFAVIMVTESTSRFISPVEISYNPITIFAPPTCTCWPTLSRRSSQSWRSSRPSSTVRTGSTLSWASWARRSFRVGRMGSSSNPRGCCSIARPTRRQSWQ
jgi:hypothetical protein